LSRPPRHQHPMPRLPSFSFTHDPPPPALSTLSLHDALPISARYVGQICVHGSHQASKVESGNTSGSTRRTRDLYIGAREGPGRRDRKSTRLNSSHVSISYAVFCLKKKSENRNTHWTQRQYRP